FFQAEDGIRDFHVTGVQTCALPILLQACANGNAEIAGVLLDAGADGNARDADDLTPLLEAARGGHSEVLARLAQARPDVTAVDRSEERRVGKEWRARWARRGEGDGA